jgi:hypothetical protein
MLEMLVLSLCVGRFECSEAWKAYYAQNKPMQSQIKILEHTMENEIGSENKQTIYAIMPLAMLAGGAQAKIKLLDNLYFNGGRANQNISFEVKF